MALSSGSVARIVRLNHRWLKGHKWLISALSQRLSPEEKSS
jgi:hypothetical protein